MMNPRFFDTYKTTQKFFLFFFFCGRTLPFFRRKLANAAPIWRATFSHPNVQFFKCYVLVQLRSFGILISSGRPERSLPETFVWSDLNSPVQNFTVDNEGEEIP